MIARFGSGVRGYQYLFVSELLKTSLCSVSVPLRLAEVRTRSVYPSRERRPTRGLTALRLCENKYNSCKYLFISKMFNQN